MLVDGQKGQKEPRTESVAPVATLRCHDASVTDVAFIHQHNTLLSAAADGRLALSSLATFRAHTTIVAHDSVLSVHASADGATALSHGRDGRLKMWDLATAKLIWDEPFESLSFCKCAVSLSSALVALPSASATEVVLWDLRQRQAARTLEPAALLERAGMCMCLHFLDASSLLAGLEDGTLQHFDLRAGSAPFVRKLHSEPLLCVDTDASGRRAITGAADRKLCAVRLDGAEAIGPPQEVAIPVTSEKSGAGGISSVSVRADDKVVASGGWDRRVRVWQWRGLKPLAVLKGHSETINAVRWSGCGEWLASGSADKTVSLWRLNFKPSRPVKDEKP